MGMGLIGSIQGIPMQGNGVMARVMVSEFKLAPMVAVISVNSSTASSMVSAVTILGQSLFFYSIGYERFLIFFPE